MEQMSETGWKPIPLALKILAVVFVLWSVGAVMNLPNLQENGLPLFGTFIYGMSATLVDASLYSVLTVEVVDESKRTLTHVFDPGLVGIAKLQVAFGQAGNDAARVWSQADLADGPY